MTSLYDWLWYLKLKAVKATDQDPESNGDVVGAAPVGDWDGSSKADEISGAAVVEDKLLQLRGQAAVVSQSAHDVPLGLPHVAVAGSAQIVLNGGLVVGGRHHDRQTHNNEPGRNSLVLKCLTLEAQETLLVGVR